MLETKRNKGLDMARPKIKIEKIDRGCYSTLVTTTGREGF